LQIIWRSEGCRAIESLLYPGGNITEALLKQNPGDIQLKQDLAVNYGRRGGVLIQPRDFAAARPNYENALEITQKLSDRDPGNSQWRRDLLISYGRLCPIDRRSGTHLRNCRHLFAGNGIPQSHFWHVPLSEKEMAPSLDGLPSRLPPASGR